MDIIVLTICAKPALVMNKREQKAVIPQILGDTAGDST
jgi:hypothetical protein